MDTDGFPVLQDYDFAAKTDVTNVDVEDTIESENVFKGDPGFGGLVQWQNGDPVPNVEVRIYDSKNTLLKTVFTDQDGWYMWQYKYTGKAATFTVKLPAPYNLAQSVILKSNGYAIVNFNVDEPD